MLTNTKISDLIFDPEASTGDFISRFNKYPVIKRESDTQHQYWVTLFVRIISQNIVIEKYRKANISKIIDFVLNCTSAALVHDYLENVTDDVAMDLKHNDFNGEAIAALISEYEEHHLNQKNLFEGQYVNNFLVDSICHENDLIKKIIKVGDWLATLKYLYQELNFGNKNLKAVIERALSKYIISIVALKKVAIEEFGFDYINNNLFDQLYIYHERFK